MRPSILLQHCLPHRLLSRLVLWATRWTWGPWRRFLIHRIVKAYDVDLDEAAEPDPAAHPHFNAFFTRALKAGARPLDPDPSALLCPADGRVSQAGAIRAGELIQAKGSHFPVAAFLADETFAAELENGSFATIYLSPRDYHRVHMPLDGELLETVHVPGRLFSVAPAVVAAVPRLFARNERLICHFQGEQGRFVVALVGAMLVSGVETVWGGVEIPPYASRIQRRDWRGKGVRLARGAEMGRFNMGSTVILLLPAAVGGVDMGLQPEQPVRMGRRLGHVNL